MDEVKLPECLCYSWLERPERSKKRNGRRPDPAPAGGRTPLWDPQNQTLLYHVAAMKGAGVKMGGPCSLFAEARRFKFS